MTAILKSLLIASARAFSYESPTVATDSSTRRRLLSAGQTYPFANLSIDFRVNRSDRLLNGSHSFSPIAPFRPDG